MVCSQTLVQEQAGEEISRLECEVPFSLLKSTCAANTCILRERGFPNWMSGYRMGRVWGWGEGDPFLSRFTEALKTLSKCLTSLSIGFLV